MLDLSDECAKLSISPGDPGAEGLSVADVTGHLDAAGVCHGILDDAIADAVEQFNTHQETIKEVIVARQQEPQPGEPETVERLLADGQVAACGDTIVRMGAGTAPIDGKTIFGKAIEAPELIESRPTAGANTEIAGNEIRATVYGIVSSGADEISVDLPIEIDADDMKAFLDIYPHSAVGTLITLDMVLDSLQAAGICYGLDDELVQSTVRSVAESGSPSMHLAVAEGQAAKRGEDAWVENLVEVDTLQGEFREDGSVDFRERHVVHNVSAGTIICRRAPPTEGRSRIDVYGQSEPPVSGEDIVIQAGENVEKRDDKFLAKIDGALKIKNNVVSVLDAFTVAGDIDMESGNLHLDKGAISIRGSVLSGFEVTAASDIMINGLVEDASLESGADIQISGGILHAEVKTGSIRAEGRVTAKFAQNAQIVAGEDITINGVAINCDLRAGGDIVISGNKACLVGGTARAAKTIRVGQLGSEAEVITHVEISPDEGVVNMLRKKLQEIRAAIEAGDAEEGDQEALSEYLYDLIHSDAMNATIYVDGKVFPGVIVKIIDAEYTFTAEDYHCKISLDENRKISVSPWAG